MTQNWGKGGCFGKGLRNENRRLKGVEERFEELAGEQTENNNYKEKYNTLQAKYQKKKAEFEELKSNSGPKSNELQLLRKLNKKDDEIERLKSRIAAFESFKKEISDDEIQET